MERYVTDVNLTFIYSHISEAVLSKTSKHTPARTYRVIKYRIILYIGTFL